MIWFFLAAWKAGQITGLSEEEKFIADDNPIQKGQTILKDKFSVSSDAKPDVILFWGVEKLNKTDVTAWNASFAGTAIFDKGFNLDSRENRKFLQDVCGLMKYQSFIVNATTECWTDEFQTYLYTLAPQKEFAEMNATDFKQELLEWTTNYTEGRVAKATNKIALMPDNKTILYTEIKGKADTTRTEPR